MAEASAYLELSDEEQAEALRPVALAAAEQFGLAAHRLEVACHAYNTTYSLHSVDGRRFALRINTNSTSSPTEVLAQQLWQVAIARDTTVQVPQPVPTADGQWSARVESAAMGREVLVTCASWLEGPDVVEPDAEVAHEVGRAMALLHEHAQTWQLPAGGAMPLFDSPLFGDVDQLDTAPPLDDAQREVLRLARELAETSFRRVYAGMPAIPLHADLHGGNLKWHEGRLAIFDFDDCGLGVPVLDLAISTFYLRGGDEAAEQALRAGYAEVTPLPDVTTEDFEALIAARQLLLANALLLSSTTEFREMAKTYLPLAVDRLRHWLDTGRFTRLLEARP